MHRICGFWRSAAGFAAVLFGAGGFWGFGLSLWLLRRCRDIVRLVLSPVVVFVRFFLRLFY